MPAALVVGRVMMAMFTALASVARADAGQALLTFAPAPETNRPVSAVGVSVYGGVGDSTGTIPGVADPLFTEPFYGGFIGGLSHQRRGSTHAFSAAVGTSYRYFPEVRELLNLEGAAAASLTSRMGQHSRIRFSQTAQYTQFRQFGVAPVPPEDSPEFDGLPTSNPEAATTTGQPFYDLTSAVSFVQSFGPRSSLTTDYSYRISLNDDWSARPETHDARLRYQRGVGASVGYWLGAAYRVAQTSFEADVPRTHATDFEGGVGHTRRRTTLNASSGVTLVTRGGGPTQPESDGLDYQVTGSAGISQALGRSWNLRVDYTRFVQFVQAFPDPYVTDQAGATVSGAITRLANLNARLFYWSSSATATTAGPDQRVQGWYGVARLDVPISARTQAYVLYQYTENQFSEGALASLPSGVRPRTNWGGLRAGVDVWLSHVH